MAISDYDYYLDVTDEISGGAWTHPDATPIGASGFLLFDGPQGTAIGGSGDTWNSFSLTGVTHQRSVRIGCKVARIAGSESTQVGITAWENGDAYLQGVDDGYAVRWFDTGGNIIKYAGGVSVMDQFFAFPAQVDGDEFEFEVEDKGTIVILRALVNGVVIGEMADLNPPAFHGGKAAITLRGGGSLRGTIYSLGVQSNTAAPDFKVQRGRVDIVPDTATTTLTAGVDYEAPTDASKAFFRLVGIHYTGAGSHSSDFAGAPGRYTLVIENPQNIMTSLDISMYEATVDEKSFDWEIIEYVGAAGGANEMVVRHAEHVELRDPPIYGGSTGEMDSSPLSGVTDPAKLALFITGQRTDTVGARGESGAFIHALEYTEATQTVKIRKGNADSRVSSASIVAVEFIGANWTVQRIQHEYTVAGAVEIPVDSVGDPSNAFMHVQQIVGADNGGARNAGYETNLPTHSLLTLYKTHLQTPHTMVVWLVSNPDINVQRLKGTRVDNSGTDPHIIPVTISAVEPSTSSIWGEGGNSNEAGDSHRGVATFTITDPTTVSLLTGRDAFTLNWRFEVVQWPYSDSDSDPTPPATFSLLSVDLDNSIAPGQMSVSILCENAGTIAGTVDIDGVLQNVSSWADGEIILSEITADALQSGSHTLRVKKGVAP